MKIRKLAAAIVIAGCLTTVATAVGFGEDAKKAPGVAKLSSSGSKLVDLNTANPSELEALPAIGKVKALKIAAARPFKGKDELVSKGILTLAEYNKVKDLVIAKQGK